MSDVAAPLDFVALEADQDLRRVSWNQRFLEREAKRFGLKHRQAVIYRNLAKTTFRIIAMFYQMPVLILTPVDPGTKISLYIQINDFLRKFRLDRSLQKQVAEEIEEAKARLERAEQRRVLAALAEKRRKS